MSKRQVLIAIGLIIGCWPGTGSAQGQTPIVAADALPPAGTDARPAGGEKKPQTQQDVEGTIRQLAALAQAQAQARAQPRDKAEEASEIDRLKAQMELQQKQIDVLLKMTQVLTDQVKKQSPAGAAVEQLQEQVATQEAAIQQGARRDQELAHATDAIVEQIDAAARTDPPLPAPLRELFSPTRNNESPLSIYGQLTEDFYVYSKQNSTFRPPTLQLHPYLLLNEKWLLSANIIFLSNSITMCRMQAERYVNDYLTIVAGRFYSPIGFYTERIRLQFVQKTVDEPLMFNQVYPDQLYFDGLQFRGAAYLFNSPVKMEYVGFVANGLSVAGSNLSPRTYSDLSNFTDSTADVNSAKAYGGRFGLSIPEHGFITGLSGLANGTYDSANQALTLWDYDANYHKGNWDARFELAKMNQQTPNGVPNIHRFGYYAQVAYRQYNNPNIWLQKLEGVFRFDHVQFEGINIAQTGISFGGFGFPPARQPLDRNRYYFGLNYWFYPSLALKVAMEIYDELGVPSLRDNGFVGQVVWGF